MKYILYIIKYAPAILTTTLFILQIFNIINTPIMAILLILSIILLMASYYFKFCIVHRMPFIYLILLSSAYIFMGVSSLLLTIGISSGATLIPYMIYSYRDITIKNRLIKHIKELFGKYLLKDVKNYKNNTAKVHRRH